MVINIRVDEEFKRKLEYLQRINGYKNKSDTIRKTVEKEYRKEVLAEPRSVHKEIEDGRYKDT